MTKHHPQRDEPPDGREPTLPYARRGEVEAPAVGVVTMRLLYAAIHLLAALLLLALALVGVGFLLLGILRPPALREWAGQGVLGVLAGIVVCVGIALWGALAVSAAVWAIRCFRRVGRMLMGDVV